MEPSVAWSGRVMVLLRGLPGSVKSKFASELVYHAMEYRYTYDVVSADHYFQCLHGYEFDRAKLSRAHADCQSRALTALRRSTDIVVVDNTNITRREYEPYVAMAFEFGYRLHVIEFECIDVPDAMQLRMRSRSRPPEETVRGRFLSYNQRELDYLNTEHLQVRAEIVKVDPWSFAL